MIHYFIQVDLQGDGKWCNSMDTTYKKWRSDLKRHRQEYGEPARAIRLETVRKLKVLR